MQRRTFVADDGVSLVADVAGPEDAPTIILAHGGGQTRHAWRAAMQSLVDAGYRVINYDARGHGDSGWSPDNTYPAERRWGDMALIMASAGTPVAIVGASMGGSSALHGLSLGARPDALVLVDIAPNAERAGMIRVRDFMQSGIAGFGSLAEAADAVAAYAPPNRPRSTDFSGLKRNLRESSDGRWRWHWDPGILDIDIDHERATMADMMTGLRAVRTVPMLLVRGLQSDVVTEETVAVFRAQAPALHVLEIGGAGHMVAGDRNDAFNTAVCAFLAEHMPAV